MRIAMIGHKSIFIREGGVEKTVRNLSFYLSSKGHEVTIYDRSTSYLNKNGLLEPVQKQVKVDQRIKVVKVSTLRGALEVPIYSFFAAIRAAFSKNDIVIFHASGSCWMIPIAKLFGKKTIAYVHAIDSHRSKWEWFASWYLSRGEKTAAKRADAFLVLSEAIRDYLKKRYGREATITINGIDKPKVLDVTTKDRTLSKFNLKKDEYLFWSGRFCPEKGLQYLIPAYFSCNTNKKLVLAGEKSDDKDSFYCKIHEMCEHNENILFIGSRNEEELQILYQNSFAFVFPSELEGMAHSLLEALSNGATCILSDIPENKSVAKDHAIYFQSKNTLELEEKLKYLLEHPEIRDELNKGQQDEILSEYSLEKSGAQMLDICKTLLSK